MILWLWIMACAPIEPRFHVTKAACADGLDGTCRRQLRMDYGAPDESPEWWYEGTFTFLEHCVRFNGALDPSQYVSLETLEWLEEAPGRTKGAKLYNRVADAVAETRFGESAGSAEYIPQDEAVLWDNFQWQPTWMSSTLVHEAGHAEPGSGHVACPRSGEYRCDRGWEGALGKQVAFAHWAAAYALTEADAEDYTMIRDMLVNDILPR